MLPVQAIVGVVLCLGIETKKADLIFLNKLKSSCGAITLLSL